MILLTLQSLHFSDMIAAAFQHILQRVFALSALGFDYNQYMKMPYLQYLSHYLEYLY